MKSNAKNIRVSLDRTLVQAGVYAGVSLATIGKIERGDPNVQLRGLLNLAFSYGVSPVDLLPGLTVSPGKELRFDHEIEERQHRKRTGRTVGAGKVR